jgi:hypothetical protein
MEPVVSTDNKKSANPLQQLDAIDLMLLRRHYRDAAHAYFQLLDSLAREWATTSFSRSDHHGDENYAMYEICERATRQWLLILSSDVDLAKLNYTLFIANIGMVHAILMGTSQGTLDDFISALHRKTGGNYQISDFLRIVLAWCPNSRIGFDIFAYYSQAPELIMAHALGCVSGIGLISEESNRHRNKAIDFLITHRDSNIDKLGAICLSSAVLDAWMRCSYAEHPDKHKVKHLLNRMIQRGFQLSDKKAAAGKVPPVLRERPANRPLLVVPLETFSGKHAMYRCYANILLACREHFYTVGLAGTKYYDDDTVALFDEFFDADEISGSDPRVMESIILSWQPDAVYYPSVGMAVWVIALANTRLAPVQAMSIGHPATSMSRTMDYVIVDEGRVADGKAFSETVLAMPHGSNRFVLPSGSQRVAPIMAPPADGIIRVAVPSISQKLTGSFIRALRRAQQALPGKLQYVFFMGTRSVYYAATVQSLSRQLKHIECHGELAYNDYITELNRCHLHAGTFPFGGTNSLIDSMRQGLPILAFEGEEPHARVDGDFVRRAGLPEKLVCHSEDEYVERLVELVSDPDQLMALRRYLVNEVDIDRIFLQEGRPECYAEALAALVSKKPD